MKINLHNTCITRRELECLSYIMQGMTSKSIARNLGVSYRTVESHIERLKIKTKTASKTSLIQKMMSLFLNDLYRAT